MTDARTSRTSVVVVQESPDSDARTSRTSAMVIQESGDSDARVGRSSIMVIQHAPAKFVYGWSMLPIRSN